MKNKYLYKSALILLLVGCSSVQPNSFPPTFVGGGPPTLSTFTEIPEIHVSQTAAPHEVEVALRSCFEESNDEILLASTTKGSLVSRGFYSPIFLDIQANTAYEIPLISENSYTRNISISPDRNLLATLEESQNEFFQFKSMNLRILNARGEMVEKIVFEIPGLHKIRWRS